MCLNISREQWQQAYATSKGLAHKFWGYVMRVILPVRIQVEAELGLSSCQLGGLSAGRANWLATHRSAAVSRNIWLYRWLGKRPIFFDNLIFK